jgi:hypothetical protein
MRRQSFRKLFAPAEDHRGRRAGPRRLTRMSPCVEGAEQRLSLSAVGVPTLNTPVAAQVVATGTVVNQLRIELENTLISAY